MTNYLHRATGYTTDASHWSFTLTTSGSISETAAEAAFSAAIVGYFTDANVKVYYSTGFKLSQTTTSTTSTTFHQTTKTTTTHSTFGTSGATQLPTALCPVWTLNSTELARWGRGRVFLPTPTIGSLSTANTGVMDSTHAANMASALATVRASLQTAGLQMVLWTREATKDGRPAFSTIPVVSGYVSNKFHFQTRRGDKLVWPKHAA